MAYEVVSRKLNRKKMFDIIACKSSQNPSNRKKNNRETKIQAKFHFPVEGTILCKNDFPSRNYLFLR